MKKNVAVPSSYLRIHLLVRQKELGEVGKRLEKGPKCLLKMAPLFCSKCKTLHPVVEIENKDPYDMHKQDPLSLSASS